MVHSGRPLPPLPARLWTPTFGHMNPIQAFAFWSSLEGSCLRAMQGTLFWLQFVPGTHRWGMVKEALWAGQHMQDLSLRPESFLLLRDIHPNGGTKSCTYSYPAHRGSLGPKFLS